MLMVLLAGLLLGVAAYAQWQIPDFVLRESTSLALRLLLVGLGVAIGFTMVRTWTGGGVPQAAVFFTGFGLVHVPAALILFLKRRRGEGKS